MMKLQVHAPTDVVEFQQGASPTGTDNRHHYRLRAVVGVARDQGLPLTEKLCGIAAIGSVDFEHRVLRQVSKKHSPVDLGLDDAPSFNIPQMTG